jgi:hypothetical protein
LKAEPQGNCFQPHVLQRVRRRLASWAKYGYNDNVGLVHLWLLQQFRATSFPIRWPVLA